MRYEILDFSTHMPVQCNVQHITFLPQHLHDHFEMIFILSGRCSIQVDGQNYVLGEEDILTIDAHIPHELRGTNCTLVSVKFEQSIFERTLPEPRHPRFECNSTVQKNTAAFDRLRRLIAQLVKNNVDMQPGFPLRNWSLVYELMDELYNNFRVEASDSQNARSHRYALRIAEISRIINERYREEMSLSDLAGMVYLSAPYLSKFIEQHFGMNYLAYLTRVRLNHAVNDLLYTEDTIETISDNSGFPNSHAFVQAFRKEYNELPSVYRRKMRRTAPADAPVTLPEQTDSMALLKKYLRQPEVSTPSAPAVSLTPACSAKKPIRQLRHTWRSFMTVGSAWELLFEQTRELVRKMQREVGFRYIKFGGILSDEMRVCSRMPDGTLAFSFAYLDKVLDFLLSVDLRPLIQFSFMPSALARNPQKKLFNYLVSEPKDLEEWAKLIEAVTRHLIGRYGMAEVEKWLFCVWSMPDTPSAMYGFSSTAAFYAFYQKTYHTVKECGGGLRFGAPANFYIVQRDYSNWYIPFVRWCRKHGCEPDFLNFNYYDTTVVTDQEKAAPGKEAFGFVGSMVLNPAADGFAGFVNQVVDEASRECPGKPIYLTEWNNTPSQQDLLNDTCFKSCYIARGILENYDRLESFGYWTLTDWMGEAPLPQQQFFGGLGLFTASAIPKAGYHVFPMLRRLGDTLLGKGEGWFVTASSTGYQIMLYNYRHFSYLYALGERFDMTFTERYTPFSPEQSLDVHLQLRDVEDGAYTVKEIVLNRKHGSAFDIWTNMGALEPDEQEIAYLSSCAAPAQRKYIVTAASHTLELDAWLDMLEVRLLLVEKR